MTETARKNAKYEDLYAIPDNMVGEIIDGELIVTPRPTSRHGYAATALIEEVGPPYHRGRGGPGGWIFIVEPEITFGNHTIVPDIAGWKTERFVWEQNPIPVIPDWACEILSPSTARLDRVKKMSKYAEHEVSYFWLLDPGQMILEVYRLESGRWSLLGAFEASAKFRAEPFQEIEINLGDLWPGP